MSEKVLNFSTAIPVRGSFDVIVAGGGVAGVAAAITARRENKTVLLIEKSNIPGGLATLGLVNLFEPLCNGRGKQIIRGLAEELLDLSIKYGYDSLPKSWEKGKKPDSYTEDRYMTRFSPYIFALAMTEVMHDAGVEILFDSTVTAAVTDSKVVKNVIVSNKSGLEAFEGKVFIDTTGDGDLLARVGVPCVDGRNFFTFLGNKITLESCKRAVELKNIRFAYKPVRGGNATLYGENQPDDMAPFTGISSDTVNEFIIKNQLEMLRKLKDDDRLSRDVAQMPSCPTSAPRGTLRETTP